MNYETEFSLMEIRKSLDELGNDGDCPQLNTIQKCLNRINSILVREGY